MGAFGRLNDDSNGFRMIQVVTRWNPIWIQVASGSDGFRMIRMVLDSDDSSGWFEFKLRSRDCRR